MSDKNNSTLLENISPRARLKSDRLIGIYLAYQTTFVELWGEKVGAACTSGARLVRGGVRERETIAPSVNSGKGGARGRKVPGELSCPSDDGFLRRQIGPMPPLCACRLDVGRGVGVLPEERSNGFDDSSHRA